MAQIVTITNPLTGQPTQVDQLDHTAQQIDDGLNIARGVSNPNLLDNWYFGNPVDQRQGRIVVPNTTYYSNNTLTTSAGTTSAYVTAYRYATGTANGVNYASFKLTDSDTAPTYYAALENVVRGYTGAGMTVDRWKLLSDTMTVLINGDGTITIHGGSSGGAFGQFIEFLPIGISVTSSALVTALSGLAWNTLQQYGYDWKASINDIVTDTGLIVSSGNTIENGNLYGFYVGANSSITVKAAKLELDFGDTQTLAHQDSSGNWQLNELPNYADTLARCQRSACILFDISNYGRAGIVVAEGSDIAHLYIPTPVTMRAIPSLQFLHGSISDLYIARSGVYTAISGVSCINRCDGYLDILLNTSGLTEGNVYTIRAKENRVCLFAIADL